MPMIQFKMPKGRTTKKFRHFIESLHFHPKFNANSGIEMHIKKYNKVITFSVLIAIESKIKALFL